MTPPAAPKKARTPAQLAADERRRKAAAEKRRKNAPPGPVETAVRKDIEALVITHPMGEALAAMSFVLARALDQNVDRRETGQLNAQLKANLLELSGQVDDADDDDLADLLDETEGGAQEPAPEVRDPEED